MPARPPLADALTTHFDRVTLRRVSLGAPQVLVRTPELEFSYGDRDRPFHVASIGKVATAVLMMQLIDDLDTRVAHLLPRGTLDGLFVVNDTDHASEVTVRQLLDHTSGIADYFGGRTLSGPSVKELMLAEPDRFWHPVDLLDFTRTRQRAVAEPDQRFEYSDTGYIVLGLLIEQLSGRQFHDLLNERIFAPAGMDDSYLMLRSAAAKGARAIAPAWLDDTEVSAFSSLSADWSGGGIVSTLDDLARFSSALHSGELVSASQLAEMQRARNRFRPGIHYGTGLMQVRFHEFFFTLRGLPRPTGHIGVLATHLFFDPVNEATIVMNFGSTREMVRSFRSLIQIEALLTAEAKRHPRQRSASRSSTGRAPG